MAYEEYESLEGLNPEIRKMIEFARENLHLSDPIPGDDYYEDENYIPEGCRACGGPYPLCKQGCALFDD